MCPAARFERMEERMMNMLTLMSESSTQLQPLIETAISHEMGLLEVSIRQAEHRLQAFERRFAMKTADFLSRYENDQIDETLEIAEWIGEFRLLERLREKIRTLRSIHFAN